MCQIKAMIQIQVKAIDLRIEKIKKNWWNQKLIIWEKSIKWVKFFRKTKTQFINIEIRQMIFLHILQIKQGYYEQNYKLDEIDQIPVKNK